VIVLGFDTATSATAVGLTLADGSTVQARDDPPAGRRPGHATRLLPLASELLSAAGLGWSELERIAVGVGPGTFTGLRIGIATARGLAQSLGVQLVGVSSLWALALGAREATEGAGNGGMVGTVEAGRLGGVLAAIDARRGEVFVAAYDGGVEVLAPHAVPPDGLGEMLQGVATRTSVEGWTAVGDGAVLYRDAFERLGVLVPGARSELHRIHARAICELGERAPASDAAVVPDYRRRPDAEIALEGSAS
jgi:tRNA threonylcarbamoyladenosine biosynthesis protein TsaB